jgi:hypothetical protein
MNYEPRQISMPIKWSDIEGRDPRGRDAEKIALIEGLITSALNEHRRLLDKELFKVEQSWLRIPPLTRRERLARRLQRIRRYCSTLWLALRGYDFPESDE